MSYSVNNTLCHEFLPVSWQSINKAGFAYIRKLHSQPGPARWQRDIPDVACQNLTTLVAQQIGRCPVRAGPDPGCDSIDQISLIALQAGLLDGCEYFGDAEAARISDLVFASTSGLMARMPVMMGHVLGAADLLVHGAVAVAIAGTPGAADTQVLLRAVASRYVPSLVLAAGEGSAVAGLPLFEGRQSSVATAYVCRHRTCELPTSDPAVLADQLTRAIRGL